MPRLILTAVLALTQLVSWSGAPLYLCLGCDGSVALDFGPTGCHHCKHARRSTAVCCNHAGHRHAKQIQVAHRSAIIHDCGCKHIQLSQPNLPVVVRAQRSGDQHLVKSLAIAPAMPSLDAQLNCPTAGPQPNSPDNHLLPSPTTLISSVIMRC